MIYAPTRTTDHDQKLKFEQQDISCYSKKQLEKLYPGGGWRIVGEVCHNNKEEEIGQLRVGKKNHKVSGVGGHGKLLNRRAGYVRVGEDEFVVILKSRIPFFILLLCLVSAISLTAAITLSGGGGPVILNPDHPLPDVDQNVTPIEDDNSQKADVADGGGSVSMIYTLEAALDLSTGEIGIYFKNPNASSHDVVLELYAVSGGEEYLLAASGRVAAGYALSVLTLSEDAPQLSEGIYTGLYRLRCYDPDSGEMALVAPEITGVTITATK